MIEDIIRSIFWDPSEKKVKSLKKFVEEIKKFEETQKDYTLEDIKLKTKSFKEKFNWLDINDPKENKKIKETLEEIKAEAFALVKTAAKLLNWKEHDLKDGRKMTWNMVHYDVQFIWGLAIHEWAIAEMKTWEWKTLVATLPAYFCSYRNCKWLFSKKRPGWNVSFVWCSWFNNLSSLWKST